MRHTQLVTVTLRELLEGHGVPVDRLLDLPVGGERPHELDENKDAHISVALSSGGPDVASVVLEIAVDIRDWKEARAWDTSG